MSLIRQIWLLLLLTLLLAFQIAAADQPGQIAIAGQILAEQHQPCRFTARAPYPGLDADDGFDASAERGLVELDQREQVTDIGNRHRRHARSSDPLDQFLDANQAIDQGIFGVQAQMNERRGHALAPVGKRGGDRREGAAMLSAGTETLQRGAMSGGRIALVLGKAVFGIALIQSA